MRLHSQKSKANKQTSGSSGQNDITYENNISLPITEFGSDEFMADSNEDAKTYKGDSVKAASPENPKPAPPVHDTGFRGKAKKSNKKKPEVSSPEKSEPVDATGVVDEVFDGFGDSVSWDKPKPEADTNLTVVDSDFSGTDLAQAEEYYEVSELGKKVKPLVNEAMQYQQDKMKLEVKEVLDDEVGYRLSRYEKRRRRRDMKDKASLIIKGVVTFIIIVIILGNTQLRTRFALVFRDFGDLFSNIISGEETSSNKLVDDLFGDLSDDIDEENTIETNGYDSEEKAEEDKK